MASDTRDRLIRATSRLLRTQGYGATGLNQVMAEADAPKGSMYFHFPGGKEQMAAAALDRFAASVGRGIAEGLDAYPTVADAITSFFDHEIARLERTAFTEGCAVATVALDAAASNDLLATTTAEAFDGWIEQLSTALEAEGRSAEDARKAAILFLATFEGAMLMAKAKRDVEPMVAVRDVVHDMLARP